MYRALYRKWRPATFSDVFGQESITTALKNQILHQKIGHAYLFTGTRGTGKTTCAKIFAKAVNCLKPVDGDPCGACEICQGLESGGILDVVEIDAASNNGIDNIRDLRDETAYTPAMCTYKVYIIDEVHMLSMQAFNALLKIMEEPPSHIIFILATTEIHKVPATILSRCQRYDFTRIPHSAIVARLEQVAKGEEINLSPDAAALIARLADGALRDALSILDTCAGVSMEIDEATVRTMAGVTDKGYLFELSRAICKKDLASVLLSIASLREKSIDVKRLCEELINHYRNLLLAGVNADGLISGISEQEEAEYKSHCSEIPQGEIIRAIKTLGSALDKMGKSTDARIELELALFALCEEAKPDAPAVKATPPSLGVAYNAPQGFAAAPENYESAKRAKSAAVAQPSVPILSPAPSAVPAAPLAQGAIIAPVPFREWEKATAAMEPLDSMLYVYMKSSRAFFDGRRVLIDASDLFLEYIRKNERSTELIKSTIESVTGKRYGIGPYEKKQANNETLEEKSAEQALTELADMGVEIEITE